MSRTAALPRSLSIARWTATASAVILAAAAMTSCSDRPAAGKSGKPIVFACVGPHGYFARRIAGPLVDVRVLVTAGANPHTFEPAASQMVALSEADLYFRAGMGFEDALCARLEDMPDGPKVVDTRQGIDLLDEAHDHAGHDDDKDPHVWMSPKLAAVQARTICDALCMAYPRHAATFNKNLAALSADLAKLDARMAKTLEPMRGRTFFVFHPAFGYLAAEFGLVQQAVEVGGKRPSLKEINSLIDKARAEKVRVIFVEPQFSSQAARTIAEEIGGVVVPLDPLAADYLTNMRAVAKAIASALAGKLVGK